MCFQSNKQVYLEIMLGIKIALSSSKPNSAVVTRRVTVGRHFCFIPDGDTRSVAASQTYSRYPQITLTDKDLLSVGLCLKDVILHLLNAYLH